MLSVLFICDPLAGQPLSYAVDNYPHLTRLDLADSPVDAEHPSIDVLIGADNYWRLVTGEVVRYEDCPTAIETCLGWVLSGPLEGQSMCTTSTNCASVHAICVDMSTDLDLTLRRLWDLETLGIKSEEESLYEGFAAFKDGRYEVQLSWREGHWPLPSNYQLSLKRLTGLICRLQQNPALLQEYDVVIRDQLDRGIIEPVKEPQSRDRGNTHYIPHHVVVRREKETTKLRVVFDASAKSTGPSLNECLYVGPLLSWGILEIILRFRVPCIGDIEKAFLMVSVHPKDRDTLHFLYTQGCNTQVPSFSMVQSSTTLSSIRSLILNLFQSFSTQSM